VRDPEIQVPSHYTKKKKKEKKKRHCDTINADKCGGIEDSSKERITKHKYKTLEHQVDGTRYVGNRAVVTRYSRKQDENSQGYSCPRYEPAWSYACHSI
jgi:hypothetical protein